MAELLPPEVANHAPLTECCPHCGTGFEAAMVDVWGAATEHCYSLGTPHARQRALENWRVRQRCPACGKPMDLQLIPVVTYRLSAVAPDPLERYTPNSRYWEAQKRGLPTSSNLTLNPQETQ